MTDAQTEGTEPEEELDERVSTPDDGFPVFDDEDSDEVQDQLDTDPDGYNAEVADLEGEH